MPVFVYISRGTISASKNDCFPLSNRFGSRASALLPVVNCSRRRGLVSPWGLPARPRGFPEPLAPASGEGKDAGAPAEADAVGGSPSAAPKRHEVGRVARRARPEMSCY